MILINRFAQEAKSEKREKKNINTLAPSNSNDNDSLIFIKYMTLFWMIQ